MEGGSYENLEKVIVIERSYGCPRGNVRTG